jgi:PBSX family phage portal protein
VPDTTTGSKVISKSISIAPEGYELPEVNGVKVLARAGGSDDESDQFKKNASDIKGYEGASSNFKRQVSTKLRKVRENVDGTAGSKIVGDKSFVDGYGAFDVVEPPYNLDYLAKLYEISAPHHAAVDAKVANIVGLGYKFVETRKTKRVLEATTSEAKLKKLRKTLDEHRDEMLDLLETFNKEDTFTETLSKVWRDYEVTGNGYLEIGRKKDGSIGYVGHIPTQTLRVRKKRDGFVQISGFKTQFFANFGDGGVDEDGKKKTIPNPVGSDTPNEVIHLKRYSPTNGWYGIPDIISAKNAVAGNEFAARFNLDYFENKAVPRHLIILKGATLGSTSEIALTQFFETGLKGQNHRSLYIPLPAGTPDAPVELTFEAIEADVQDSSFTVYRGANNSDIFMAHRVPITKVSVSEGASLAIAKDADKTFKEQVCAPEQKVLEQKLKRLFVEFTDSFELKLNEMTLTDEETQAAIDDLYVKMGVDLPNEVRAARGKPSIEGGSERVDLNAKSKDAAAANADANSNRTRDTTRSTNATDSKGNARNPKGEGRTTS